MLWEGDGIGEDLHVRERTCEMKRGKAERWEAKDEGCVYSRHGTKKGNATELRQMTAIAANVRGRREDK